MDGEGDQQTYRVVVNHEAQYSILLTEHANPSGWQDAGKTGSRQECLAFIRETWIDMRPLSLRRAMIKLSDT